MRTKGRTFCVRISLLVRIAVLRTAVEVTSTAGKGISEESPPAASDVRRRFVYATQSTQAIKRPRRFAGPFA